MELLMRRAGLHGVTGRPKWVRLRPDIIAGDLVDRRFARSEPNQLRVTDIAEHPTPEGKVYSAVVLDAHSPARGGLVDRLLAACGPAGQRPGHGDRVPQASARSVIHSDRGVRFASWAFTDRADASGLVPSMGSIGDCCDDSVSEAFGSRMQVELLDRRRWKTRIEPAHAIIEYLEIRHDRQRRHSRLACSHA